MAEYATAKLRREAIDRTKLLLSEWILDRVVLIDSRPQLSIRNGISEFHLMRYFQPVFDAVR